MVKQNVASDVVERTLKKGHVTKVKLAVENKEILIQHGQKDEDIQANSIIYGSPSAVMQARTRAEARNMYRRRESYREGYLKDYTEVIFSLVPSNLTKDELGKQGFYTDSMSCGIQATTEEDDVITVESAFVAGKKSHDSDRHDRQTINKVAEALCLDFTDLDETQILDTPILIHKSLMPNGVVDIVKLYDECAGDTFFGEEKPVQDYVAYKEQCQEREKTFQPRIDTITDKLISEAAALKAPMSASKRLAKLSEEQMVEQSVKDTTIDPRVFGAPAAYRIEHARYLEASGQLEMANKVILHAKSLAQSSSCPGGASSVDSASLSSELDKETDSTSESLEDCEFSSKECPVCHKKDVWTVVKNGKYYGDCGCSA